jgi:chromosome partitioning protein
MGVATGLLVPVQMEGLSVNGLGNIIVAMREVQSELNPNLELRGLLPTMVDARPRIVRDFIEYLKKSYGDNVCETLIHRSVKMNEAQTMLKDIYDYKPYSPTGIDYEALCKELFG